MKIFGELLIVSCFLFSFMSKAQESFPQSWLGSYKGDLLIYGTDTVKMKLKMTLNIVKTANDSVLDWTIIYDLKEKKDIRPYSLVVVDQERGHYKIDERNSIEIDSYLHNDNIFTSFFKVNESYIIATYTKIKNTLVFEIIAGKLVPVSVTGNQTVNTEEIPQVDTYPVSGRQKAVLVKQ